MNNNNTKKMIRIGRRRQQRFAEIILLVLAVCVATTTSFVTTTTTSTARSINDNSLLLVYSTTPDSNTAAITAAPQKREKHPKGSKAAPNNSNGQQRQRNIGPRKQKKQKKKKKPLKPWRAPYSLSLKTQDRIKQAATAGSNDDADATSRRILETLLIHTKPEQCNVANIVCALTLMAKQSSDEPFSVPTKNFLFQAMKILQSLVQFNVLSSRQYCNVLHAIAKLYSTRDPSILPETPSYTALSSEHALGTAEAWTIPLNKNNDSKDDDNDTKLFEAEQEALQETMELMASQLADILFDYQVEQNDTATNAAPPKKQPPRAGELSMACWALGTMKHRVRPAGWKLPPQLATVAPEKTPQPSSSSQVITFEQWDTGLDDDDGKPNERTNWNTADHDSSDNNSLNNVDDSVKKDPIPRFFHAVATCASLEGTEWKELANTAWAFASVGVVDTRSSDFLKGIAREATNRLLLLSSRSEQRRHLPPPLPRDLSQLTWSLGILQSDNFRIDDEVEELMEAIAMYYQLDENECVSSTYASAASALQRWSNADLVQLGIALSHGRLDHPSLLRALFQQATMRLEKNDYNQNHHNQFQPWEISALLWVQARLHLKGDDAYSNFTRLAPQWLYRRHCCSDEDLIWLGAQEQANLAWSLTVLEEYLDNEEAKQLLKLIFRQAALSSKETTSADDNNNNNLVQLEHAHQLWQALYVMEQDCPEIVQEVPDWFRTFLEQKWTLEKSRHKISSARHKSLSQTLDLMGIAHYNEHEEDIDVAIVLRNKHGISWISNDENNNDNDDNGRVVPRPKEFKVAVEFDGPLHFTRPKYDTSTPGQLPKLIPPRALGHTVLKYRLLKRQGWAVVRVPYYEFDKIPFWASMERQRYLQRLLKTHANLKFSESDVSEYQALTNAFRKSRFD